MPEEATKETKKVSRSIAVPAHLLAELEEESWQQRTNLSELICRVMSGYLVERQAATAQTETRRG